MKNKGHSISDVVGETLGLDPSVKYRASMLPLVRTQEDQLQFGVPSAVVDLVQSFMLPGHVTQGGDYTPDDVTNMAMNVGMVGAPIGYTTSPKGALAMGASGGIKDPVLLKNLHEKVVFADARGGAGLGGKSINKTLRTAGVTDDLMQPAKETINEISKIRSDRRNLKTINDPLINNARTRNYRLENLKLEKELNDIAERLNWNKSGLEHLRIEKKYGDFDSASKKATLESIQRNARKYGFTVRHQSGKASAKNASSVYLTHPDIGEIRVSDHSLPMHPEREYNWEQRGGPRWNREYLIPKNHTDKTINDIFNEMLIRDED